MKLFKHKQRETVESYMTKWLEQTKRTTLKPSSYDRVEESLKYQIFPNIGDVKLSALCADDIQLMVNKVAQERSYSTVKKAYCNLNNCLSFAVSRGDIKTNPAETVVLPKQIDRRDIFYYTEEQIRLVVKEAADTFMNGRYKHRYGYAVILLLNTGLRVGELLSLEWKDVDIEKRFIYVHANMSIVKSRNSSDKSYESVIQTPKSKKSVRYVPLNENAIFALKKLKIIIGDNMRVISTKNNNFVDPHKIYDTMKSILRNCEIVGTCDIVHALRHTFATILIRKGTDIKVVSEILGHSDVSTTIRIYYHVIEEQKHSAVHKLDNLY